MKLHKFASGLLVTIPLAAALMTNACSSTDSSSQPSIATPPAKKQSKTVAQLRQDEERQVAQRRADNAAQAEEKRQRRIPMHKYWVAVSGALDHASSAAHEAAVALGSGDSVSASSGFSNCASLADDAIGAASENVPDGWSDVSNAFALAASKLKDACNTAVAAVDDEKPSQIATAKSELLDYNEYQGVAVLMAMKLWVAAGGDPKSL